MDRNLLNKLMRSIDEKRSYGRNKKASSRES